MTPLERASVTVVTLAVVAWAIIGAAAAIITI